MSTHIRVQQTCKCTNILFDIQFFKTEIERKRKKEPAMAFEQPGSCEWTI